MNHINITFLEKYEKSVHHRRLPRYRVQRGKVDLLLCPLGAVLVPASQHWLNSWLLLLISGLGTRQTYGRHYLLYTWVLFHFWSTVMLVLFFSLPMHLKFSFSKFIYNCYVFGA